MVQAQELLQEGRSTEAWSSFERVLREVPHHSVALKLGAVAAFQSGNKSQAVDLMDRAIALFPEDSEAHFNLGVLHQSTGRLDAALACFGRAAELAPDFTDAHYNVATALHELGRAEEAVMAYRRTLETNSRYAPAFAGLAFTLRGLDQLDEALSTYEKAVALAPQDAQALSGYGITLQLLDRLSEAAEALNRAAELDPHYTDAATNLADVLVQQDKPATAVEVCDRFLASNPGDSGILASKAIALGECGNTDAVAALVDFDRFVWPEYQDKSEGFADLAAFNKALHEHMLRHPTLVDAPASHATRQGKHTGELLGDEAAPIKAFQAMVTNAVVRYKERLGRDWSHPFVANALERWRLTAWSIVLQGGGGYQAPHIHPSAWLSGVYYARVPKVVDDPESGKAGWIEFGLPSEEFHWRHKPEIQAFRPEPGLLVLFPSYFFHRTIPYDGDDTRISIAFDVLPA